MPGISFELGLALGLALCFSIGDLSVIALFGNNDFQTIPWLIYQTYGRYGLSDANALALILLVVTFFFFLFFPNFGANIMYHIGQGGKT